MSDESPEMDRLRADANSKPIENATDVICSAFCLLTGPLGWAIGLWLLHKHSRKVEMARLRIEQLEAQEDILETQTELSERTLRIDRQKKRYSVHWFAPIPLYSGGQEYEYKIAGDKVLVRLWSEYIDRINKTTHFVENNIVMESEIRKKESDGFVETVKEKIEKYKKLVEWHELEFSDDKNFILSKHLGGQP